MIPRIKLLPFDYAIRNLGRSPKRLALVCGGSMLVSMLVLGAVAFARGMDSALSSTGLVTNALVVGSGSEESLERSEIPPTTAGVLAASIDGLAVVAGVPAVSPEIQVALPLTLEGAQSEDATEGTTAAASSREAPPAIVRGFQNEAFLVHPQVRLVAGRWPDHGADEIAAAPGALARVAGAQIGTRVIVAGTPFEIVGIFDAPGTTMHGEFWMRLERVAQLTQRTTHSCVVAALGSADMDDVDAFSSSRLDLETISMRESAYYARLGDFFAPIRLLVIVTALLVSSGGILGGINAMYAAFSSRVREVGTLQALGFSRSAIAISLILESTVACVAGALGACLAATLLLDGIAIQFSMGSFGLQVDATAIACALVAGMLLGVLGALPAIFRCLSLPIPNALRS